MRNRERLIDLLLSIKDDASLLAEFTATTVDSLRDKLASEEGTLGNDTFMNIDVSIQDDNRMKTLIKIRMRVWNSTSSKRLWI